MIDRDYPELSVARQSELLDISRSSVYYIPVQADAYELELMRLIDKQYLLTPFYGSRKMTARLRGKGHQVNRKRVQRLMRLMGIEAHLPAAKDLQTGLRPQGVPVSAQRT
jgi:putative transposase